jgi:hypothetical protein
MLSKMEVYYYYYQAVRQNLQHLWLRSRISLKKLKVRMRGNRRLPL